VTFDLSFDSKEEWLHCRLLSVANEVIGIDIEEGSCCFNYDFPLSYLTKL
jgi:hypothetical protein